MRRHVASAIGAVCLLFGVDLLFGAGFVHAQLPEEAPAEIFQETIVELRAGQISSVTVFAYTDGNRVWIPARDLFDLVEIQSDTDFTGMLLARWEPGSQQIGIQPDSSRAWNDDQVVPLATAARLQRDDILYVEATLLADLLQIRSYVNLTELTVSFQPVDHLPVGQRYSREHERFLRFGRHDPTPADLIYPTRNQAWRGASLDWVITLPDPGYLGAGAYGLVFGGAAVGGALQLGARGNFDGGNQDFVGSWQKAWPQHEIVRQVRLGRTTSTGPLPRAIDGFAITNSPFMRPTEFGTTVVRGQIDPGWEVELYHQGELIGYQRVDERGMYEFVAPLNYGTNPMEIRAYGPHGEVRIMERAARVDLGRIPGRRFEYGVSGGDCVNEDCDGALNLDLRLGVNNHLTLRAGSESFVRLGQRTDLHHPYVGFAGSPMNVLTVSGDYVGQAWGRFRLDLEPSADFRSFAQYTNFNRNFVDPILTRTGELDRTQAGIFWRPLHSQRGLFLNARGTRDKSLLGERTRATLSLDSRPAGIRTTLRYTEEWSRVLGAGTTRNSLASVSASTVVRAPFFALLNGLQVRAAAEADLDFGRRHAASLAVGRQIARNTRFDVGVAWSRLTDDPLLTFSFSSMTSVFRATAYISRSETASNGALYGEGSLRWNDGTNQIEASPLRMIGRGGISGRTFLDANGNGELDADENGVAGVRLIVGNHMVETDGYGYYSVANLVPFEPADIQVDQASLDNPLLVPTFERAQAQPLPNGFSRIDLPLVESVEVFGLVLLREGPDDVSQPVGGVPVVLERIDGDRRIETRTYHDGEFYLLGVPPGRYRVGVRSDFLARQGWLPTEDPRIIQVGAGDEAVGPLQLRLSPVGP